MVARFSLPAIDSAEDQRLGGARSVGGARPLVPAGYRAEAVAAGLTDPCAVAFDPRGLLYVVERGHPRRTPARLLRIDIATGAASVVAAIPNSLLTPAPWLALIEAVPTLAGAGSIWRLDGSDWTIVTVGVQSEGDAPGPDNGPMLVFPGSTVAAGDLYVCDSGTPALAARGSPNLAATGFVWRVTASPQPGGAAESFRWREGYGRLAGWSPRKLSPAVALGAGATFLIALSLAAYYRRSRARR